MDTGNMIQYEIPGVIDCYTTEDGGRRLVEIVKNFNNNSPETSTFDLIQWLLNYPVHINKCFFLDNGDINPSDPDPPQKTNKKLDKLRNSKTGEAVAKMLWAFTPDMLSSDKKSFKVDENTGDMDGDSTTIITVLAYAICERWRWLMVAIKHHFGTVANMFVKDIHKMSTPLKDQSEVAPVDTFNKVAAEAICKGRLSKELGTKSMGTARWNMVKGMQYEPDLVIPYGVTAPEHLVVFLESHIKQVRILIKEAVPNHDRENLLERLAELIGDEVAQTKTKERERGILNTTWSPTEGVGGGVTSIHCFGALKKSKLMLLHTPLWAVCQIANNNGPNGFFMKRLI